MIEKVFKTHVAFSVQDVHFKLEKFFSVFSLDLCWKRMEKDHLLCKRLEDSSHPDHPSYTLRRRA